MSEITELENLLKTLLSEVDQLTKVLNEKKVAVVKTQGALEYLKDREAEKEGDDAAS